MGKKDEDEDGSESKTMLEMIIYFTLLEFAYATIALRELVKRQTSKIYEKELKLEGYCEAKVGKATEKAKEEGISGKANMEYSPGGLTTVPGAEKGKDLKKETDTEEKAAI